MNERLSLFKKWGGVFLLLLTFSWNVTAQNINVQGTVVDEFGEPAIGATIQIRGTTQGTITNLDGNFTLSAPAGSILVISFVGYETQEIAASANMRIVLQPDAELLDELVVVGYGVMRRSDVTGSVARARGEDIIRGQSFNALDGLRGRAAGVNIFSNTGQPGGEMRVIIRGISTIQASTAPLFVVDGVVMSDLQFLNPNDIESIEVLKDASSAAIYGARGANGVILVTTHRGGDTQGRARISYASSVSVGTMQRQMDVMDSDMWMAAFQEGLHNANRWQGTNFNTDLSQIFTDERFFRNGRPIYNTNWQDEASRTAISHNHQISITRGGRDHSSGAFLNFTDQQGILHNTYQKRVNARLVFDDRPVSWLSTQNNLMVNHTWGNRISDNPYGLGALRTMIENVPFLPVQHDRVPGGWTQVTDILTSPILRDQNNLGGPTNRWAPEDMGNPVEAMKRVQMLQLRTQIFGNTALIFHFNDYLQLRTQFGVEYRINNDLQYHPVTPRPLNGFQALGESWASNNRIFYWQQETFATYNRVLGRHRINAMTGMSWQAWNRVQFTARDRGFTDDALGWWNMGTGTDRPQVTNLYDRWTMNSYFARVAYSLDDRYMATFTARVDGSSRFGAHNKYAFFPSIGLSWRMSEEDFLRGHRIISNLRPRTSFGITGNSEIPTFQSLSTISSQNVIIGDQLFTGNHLARMSNPDLRWERTATWDFGLEVGLFDNRLNFEASYYYRYTTDLLLNVPLPHTTGFNVMMQNIGAVSNRGVDLLLTAHPVQANDFSWTSTVNLSWTKNRVERLNPDAAVDPITGARQILMDGFTGYEMIIREGDQLSSFFGHRRAGIFDGNPANWNAETHIIPNLIGERVLYRDREIIGNGLPNWMGSFMNTFRFGNFDMTVDLQFSLGAQVMQEFFHSTEGRFLTSGLTQLYTNAWHPERNPTGTGQAIRLANFGMGSNANADDTWLANGNYLRGNLIQLGYTFPRNMLQNMNISSLRVFANANNAFLITANDFLGFDPDNSSRLGGNNWGANRQFFTFPRPRTFTFGLNVTL